MGSRMSIRRALVVAGILGVGLALRAAAAAEREHIVLVKRWEVVEPGELTIARGDRVSWWNVSGQPFALIFERVPGAPETPLAIHTEFSAQFDRPGTYKFLVTGMSGPRGGSLVPRPGDQPTIIPVAASSGIGWITVK